MRKIFFASILIAFALLTSTVYAQNETIDPCAGMTCNSPPAATCSGNNLIIYSSPGTCSNGQCSYSSSSTTCPNGCENGQCKTTNFCDTTTCGSSTKTCPDGFVASCTQTCDRTTQSCVQCEPSCQGHETPTGQNATDPCAGITCNSPPPNYCSGNNVVAYSSSGACSAGQCTYSSSTYSCLNGCSSGQCSVSATGCPAPPAQPTCPSDAYPKPEYSNGCVTGYKCEPLQTQQCAKVITPARDAAGNCKEFPDSCLPPGWTKTDKCPAGACGNNICELGEADTRGVCPPGADPLCSPSVQAGTCPSDCTAPTQQACPAGCECKFEDGRLITYCPTQQSCNYNGKCESNEGPDCKDCIGGECPVSRQCSDGSTVNCYKSEFGCSCQQCPLSAENIPPGCRQEVDQAGFVRVVCEQQQVRCPPVPQEVRIKCVDGGGQPRFGRDQSGCDTFQCDFGGQRTESPVFAAPVKCPSPEEVSRSLEKCKEFNLEGAITFEGGCKIGKCIQEKRRECPRPTESEKMVGEEECRKQGLELVFEFDGQCHQPQCGRREKCPTELPKEAYDKCAENGGQLIVRRDDRGCVAYSKCLTRGNTEQSFVEDVTDVPDTTDLLSIAFKLEDLKLDLDRLARKTDDIANYYRSTGSSEEKRFRRVSDMFSVAKDKVDEIKTKLRQRANDITKDDVLEIKQDLRYIKDVVIKDILFVMLGSGDEIEEIKSGASKECGTDGSCFDRAIRVCQTVTFRPEGRDGPIVEIRGLEGDACILYAKLPEGQGPPAGTVPGANPPYDMTCKIQKYSLGVRNPETDIFPYCTGSMVELIKKYGTGPQSAPGVPGKCSGDECREYCGRGPQEAKECLQYLGQYLPAEAKTHLEELASGNIPSSSGGGFGGFGGEFESEFQQPQQPSTTGGGQLCPDGICDDFEQRNPNACPQDCGGSAQFPQNQPAQQQFSQPQFPQPTRQFQQPQSVPTSQRQPCSGCLNNGVCDPGECLECADCLRG